MTATVQGRALPAPETPATDEKPHRRLDKAYDMKRVEIEAFSLGYTPYIRRIGEEK